MKKTLKCLLALLLIFTLVGCSNDKPKDDIDSDIKDSIDEVEDAVKEMVVEYENQRSVDDANWQATIKAEEDKYTGELTTYWDFEKTKVREVIPYVDGLVHGTELNYHEDGYLSSEGEFVNGIEVSGIGYYEDGSVRAVFEYDEAGKIVRKTNYEDGWNHISRLRK